jgi:hypothetical protein
LRVRYARAHLLHSPWIYTMNRCAPLALSLALAGTLAALAPAPASAQDGQALQRNFPKAALRGQIVFGAPPDITMNGFATRLAPGYRIHGLDNLLVTSGQLDGLAATVDYTRDVEGHVYEVWILGKSEIARPWPSTLEQAATWSFDPATNAWSKP